MTVQRVERSWRRPLQCLGGRSKLIALLLIRSRSLTYAAVIRTATYKKRPILPGIDFNEYYI